MQKETEKDLKSKETRPLGENPMRTGFFMLIYASGGSVGNKVSQKSFLPIFFRLRHLGFSS